MRSRIVGVAVIGTFWNGPEAAQLPDGGESLAGLGGVQVVVENLQPGAEHFGLTKDILTTDIEGRLRQAEIRVFSDAEATSSVMFLPRFYVFVGTVPGNGPLTNLYILGLRAELHQRLLSPITKQMVASITWQNEATGYTGVDHLTEDVRRSVAVFTDAFIIDFLAANPPKPR